MTKSISRLLEGLRLRLEATDTVPMERALARMASPEAKKLKLADPVLVQFEGWGKELIARKKGKTPRTPAALNKLISVPEKESEIYRIPPDAPISQYGQTYVYNDPNRPRPLNLVVKVFPDEQIQQEIEDERYERDRMYADKTSPIYRGDA